MMENPRAFVDPFILDENKLPQWDHITLNKKPVTVAKLQLPMTVDNAKVVWIFVNRSIVD